MALRLRRAEPPIEPVLPELPERFGKYIVLGRLAQGGMAEIYRVKTVGIAGFEKVQALKRMRPEISRDPRFIRSFIDEARIAVSLNHRNIVQVFEFGNVGAELFLAMELIEGVNLRDALQAARQRGLALPVPLACHVMSEVASGIEYAHRRTDHAGRPLGIVHCDVSPPNLALSFEGYVKVLDFGVARASFVAEPRGRLRGKPRYMAPEQTRGEVPTFATDVFALGVVTWELLTGLPLFDGPDVESILAAIRRGDVPRPGALAPDVPDFLSQAVLTALSPDPAERGHAIDLGAALSRALRTLDPGAGSRALSLWLTEVYPPPPPPRPRGEVPTQRLQPIPAESTEPMRPPRRPSTPPPVDDGPPALGEKRRVIAAACRLEGGSEDDRRAVRRVLADIAYKQGAIVQADEPGWLVAIFGLELAGEDDLAHAARFALDAQEAVRDAHGPQGDAPQVRVHLGIGHGLVAPRRGAEAATGRSRRYLLLGGALDEARTLAQGARAGQTLVAGEPSRLAAQHWEFHEHGTFKRGARRVKLYELGGPRPPEHSRRARTGGGGDGGDEGARFRGRRAELAALHEAWLLARREHRRVTVGLVGEAGIGKTRLVAELAARVASERPFYIHIQATPGGREAPYALALQLIAGGMRLPPARGAAARQELCDALAAQLRARAVAADETDDVLATIEHALELRDGTAPDDGGSGANLSGRMAAAIVTLRGLMTTPRVRLTVIEDWHWADGASTEVMRQVLAGRPPPGAELLVVTTRPSEALHEQHAEISDPAALPAGCERTILVGELAADERVAFLRDRLGDNAPDATVALVAHRAGGNPLFLAELAGALGELGPGELPENARAVIAARVDRLAPAAKAALQHASVLGQSFDPGVLAELLGAGAETALADLVGLEVLVRDDAAGTLAFRHGLFQEVVYEALAGAARRDAHRRLGELLAAPRPGDGAERTDSPLAIARHLELGGAPRRAADFYLRAGRLALAAFDARAAVSAFSRALALVASAGGAGAGGAGAGGAGAGGAGAGAGGAGAASNAATLEREALSGREQAYFHLGEHDAQKRDLDALTTLSEGEPRRLADVRCRAAARHLRLGECSAAVAATFAAERAAERGGDERARGEALRLRAEAYERQADFDEALDAVTRALEIFRRIGASADETRALIGTGRIHLMCSRFDAALGYYTPALERVRRAGDAWAERIICNNVAVVYLYRKAFGDAMQHALRSLDICRRLGDRAREGDNASIVGTIYLELGRYADAREWAARGLAIHAETGSRWSRADALVYAAHAETLAGDPALALTWLDESIALAREMGARYVLANAKNQLAYALLRRRGPGDLARAEDEAMEAAQVGREAALPAVEIQGFSRAAWARLEVGDARGARGPSLQAMQRLDQVRCIEWSEEEILFTHYRVLRAGGEAMAGGFLARAYTGLMAKLARIVDPAWREAYASIELHRQIVAERAAARSQ